MSIITISVSGPVTYIDFYRPSFETTGPEKYGPGLTTVSYADRASNEPRTRVLLSTWQESSDYFIWHAPGAINMSTCGAR